MVFFIPWRVVAEESGAAHFGFGGAMLLDHSRVGGADDGGRRRRGASYGVARDSHPVSTIR
jgi:hypothetical protein